MVFNFENISHRKWEENGLLSKLYQYMPSFTKKSKQSDDYVAHLA